MATPQTTPPPPTSSTPTPQQPADKHPHPPWIHNSALVIAILGPIALFAPPRRMGLQALFLSGSTSYAINILAYDYTGESIYQRTVRRAQSVQNIAISGGDEALPEKARRTQAMMRQERARREAALPEEERARLRVDREERERAQNKFQVWWKGEEGWKAERDAKERKALEEGRGYSGLIVDQVKEVISGHKEGEAEKKDSKSEENKKP